MRRSLAILTVLAFVAPGALATELLFGNSDGGLTGIATGPNVTGLQANNDGVTMPESTDVAFAFANASIDFASTGPATFKGVADFSGAIPNKSGGTCDGVSGCYVNTESSISNTDITGGTFDAPSVVSAVVTEWNDLTSTSSGWGAASGTAADIGSGATLCAGSGFTGCTYTALTTTTMTINGQIQTAYVFDASSSNGHVNGNVTIKGNGSALVIVNFGGTQQLQTNQAFAITGGLTDDQVLYNVTDTSGMQTSGGFSMEGDLAITGAAANLDSALIDGRLYLDGTGTSSIQSNFSLVAPADVPDPPPPGAPEPTTCLLTGGALVGLTFLARKGKRTS